LQAIKNKKKNNNNDDNNNDTTATAATTITTKSVSSLRQSAPVTFALSQSKKTKLSSVPLEKI
jgi:hypothetical protein